MTGIGIWIDVRGLTKSFGNVTAINGPAEAINGRRERLRGSALGFRNLTNYIAHAELAG